MGQLFGVNDSWAPKSSDKMTFLSRQQVDHLLEKDFDVEHFWEEDAPGKAASGPKHWHAFHMIARKR